ncbi:MAG: PQQ-binding-like beta-propeller repeat protein [Bryobacterales bacterium]
MRLPPLGHFGLHAQSPALEAARDPANSWTLWGGPGRNFLTSSTGLAASWPAAGPPVLWKRELGEGYSAIAVDGDTLYTMYHRVQPYWLIFSEQQEVVVALDARTGETRWEYPYAMSFRSAYAETGPGPHVMPQIVGNLVFTSGVTGKIHALDKKTGELVWQRDLYEEFGGTRMDFGYSSHALPYKGNLIVMAGGEGKAMLSLKQANGEVVWAKQSFKNAHSAPVLIDVDGQQQVAAVAADRIVGINPDTGDLLWSFPHNTEYGLAVSMPVWGDDNLLFFSSSYGNGSRVLRLTREGEKTRGEEVWHNGRVRVHFGSVVRIGDTVYASSGHDGPAPLTAVDVPTGKILWQSREFAKANFVWAEGKLILIDQDGYLGLATATPEGLTVHAKVLMLSPNAWTLPTLVGTRLYARDRKVIMALDAGAK